MLRTCTAVDATLISAPTSTKNAEGERDPEMKQTSAFIAKQEAARRPEGEAGTEPVKVSFGAEPKTAQGPKPTYGLSESGRSFRPSLRIVG